MEKVKDLFNEEWKPLSLDFVELRGSLVLSDFGRLKRTDKSGSEILIRKSAVNGYPTYSLRDENRKTKTKYIHKLVAEHFLTKPSDLHQFVLHLDYEKNNNEANNLRWATKEDVKFHQSTNPNWLAVKGQVRYSKLTESKVRLIKKKINDPNRKTRLKMIAKQFGISEMQLHRIKKGENWSNVSV
jgi:hypothetical protein